MDEVLIVDMVDLLSFDDLAFVQHFQCDVLSGFFVFGHFDFPESTYGKMLG